MSEFRRYRFSSQLLDRYNCLRDPKVFTSHLFLNTAPVDTDASLSYLTERKATELSQAASDPTLFLNQARYLKEAFPNQFDRLVFFLDSYFTQKSRNANSSKISSNLPSSAGTPLRKPIVSELGTPLHPSAPRDDLSDIATRLGQVSQKIGRPLPAGSIPLESNEQESDFPQIQLVRNDPLMSLGRFPLAVQELCVIEDILFFVMNLDGKYFSFRREISSNLRHVIFVDESVDASILNRLKAVLKAAYCASQLSEFIVEKNYLDQGRILQALAQSLDAVLKDFYQTLTTLDQKFKAHEIGLHQFCFHLAPYTRILQSLLHLTSTIDVQEIRGSGVLRLIEEKMSGLSGDRQLRAVYSNLLEGCSRPFLEILKSWINTGTYADSKGEFMILGVNRRLKADSSGIASDSFVSNSSSTFTLSSANQIPHLLEDLKEKILLVGIYRNIQTVLNKNCALTDCGKERLTWDRKGLQDAIGEAYSEANLALLASLFQSSKLLDAMNSAKKFFFIEKSDFVQTFLASAQADLSKTNKDSVPFHLLQGAFEMALKGSSLESDSFVSNFSIELAPQGLYDGLIKILGSSSASTSTSNLQSSTNRPVKVLELLSLVMKVGFPESLIMSPKALTKYQLIFRHLLNCTELIRSLSTPLSYKGARNAAVKPDQIRNLEVMKHSMTQFVRTLNYYICFSVLQPHWERFYQSVKERRFASVEEMTQAHMNFLDTCLRESMLTNSKLVQLTSMIFSTCTKYSALIAEFNSRMQQTGLNRANEQTFLEVSNKLSTLHQHFLKYVRVLIEALQYYAARDCDHYLANFLNSLDCQFYSATN